ncbi:helix-turn-helix domain-containing protein [Bacillus sp. FJAT-47783]|uniref:helix-turn-helix domain-containing protein n=1 Tax=Bacillus sp. FJAT-47783 TaxID=2922712 RepID=UPI001FAE2470|nr:helix-turn-helix domain-containing protein [Bacillus sp. FJAT-47783]
MNEHLYDAMKAAKSGDSQALQQIITIYEPKVKYSLQKVPIQHHQDVEQELKRKLLEMIIRYDVKGVPTFTQYVKKKIPFKKR